MPDVINNFEIDFLCSIRMTKNCPYCAEEILIEAKKCKHCGEWIELKTDKSFFSNIANTTKDFLKDKKDLYNFLKTNHLRIPTEEKPVIIKSLTIYPDRFFIGGKSFLIRDISWIAYQPFVNSINFAKSYDLLFTCGVIDSETKKPFEITISAITKPSIVGKGTNLTKNEFEQLQMVYNLISTQSYDNRRFLMIQEIQKIGYFEYGDFQFYENGDIVKAGKVHCNLFERVTKGQVSFGDRYKGLRSSSTNPYAFIIGTDGIKGKLLGFELGVKLKIEAIVNNDIFEYIIDNLIQTHKLPK